MTDESDHHHLDYGNAKLTQRKCFNCPVNTAPYGTPTHRKGSNRQYPWAAKLLCRDCQSTWIICIECTSVRTHFTNFRMTNRHHHAKHVNITPLHPPSIPNVCAAIPAINRNLFTESPPCLQITTYATEDREHLMDVAEDTLPFLIQVPSLVLIEQHCILHSTSHGNPSSI